MRVHAFNKEDFGYLVAFQEGTIGLYSEEAGSLCAQGASSDDLEPFKLTRLKIVPDFHLHGPLVVWLEVTKRCNLDCPHCFMSASALTAPPEDEIPTERLLSLLDELKAQGVLSLVFTGGEPFVRPDFLDILDYANRLGFVTAIVTNGLRLTDAIIRRIPKSNVRVTISLDNLHVGDAGRNGENHRLSYLKSRLLALRDAGILCHAAATMTRRNLAPLKEVFSWLRAHRIGFREIPFSPIGRGASCPELALTVAEVPDAAELWAMSMMIERELQLENPILTFDQCYDFAFTLVYMAGACKGARFLCYISANGDAYPCTICKGVEAFDFGNIVTTPFREIWEESAKSFRQISRWENFKDCKSCSLSGKEYFCTNRCPPMALKLHGDPHRCGASPYDRASLAYRTRHLNNLAALVRDNPESSRG